MAEESRTPHYYGDNVRILFLTGAVTMLLGLPIFNDYLGIPIIISVTGILTLGLSAGLTNPKQKWDAAINMLISIVGFIVFETYSVLAFNRYGSSDKFFVSNLILSIIFLLAVYFSVKTLRGLLLNKKVELSAGQGFAGEKDDSANLNN